MLACTRRELVALLVPWRRFCGRGLCVFVVMCRGLCVFVVMCRGLCVFVVMCRARLRARWVDRARRSRRHTALASTSTLGCVAHS